MDTGLEILNVGAGDFKLTFDKNDPADIERAKRIIPDMLKRGYALFCEIDGKHERVTGFDQARECYIVRLPWEAEWDGELAEPPKDKKEKKARVPMRKTKVMAIGRSAGG